MKKILHSCRSLHKLTQLDKPHHFIGSASVLVMGILFYSTMIIRFAMAASAPLPVVDYNSGKVLGTASNLAVVSTIAPEPCEDCIKPPPTSYTLTVSKSGTGSGTISSTDKKIYCGSTCSTTYTSGVTATLTAIPTVGFVFSSWGGACSGTSLCTLTMNGNKNVTASFTSSITGSVVAVPNTTSVSGTLTPGQTDVTMSKVDLQVSSSAPVYLNGVQVGNDSGMPTTPTSMLKNIKVYLDGVQIGNTVTNLSWNGEYNYGWALFNPILLPAATTKTLVIKADADSTATGTLRLGVWGLNFAGTGATVTGLPVKGPVMTIQVSTIALQPGDIIKINEHPNQLYYIGTDMKRYVFPYIPDWTDWKNIFYSWGLSDSQVKTVTTTQLSQLALGGNITVRPGTYLVQRMTDSGSTNVYAVSYPNILHLVSPNQLPTLYGASWASRVLKIPNAFFFNYQMGASLSGLYPDGALIVYSNSLNQFTYLVYGGKALKITSDAAFVINRFSSSNVMVLTTNSNITYLYGADITGAVACLIDPAQITPCNFDSATINITSPNAGVTWKIGETHKVTWENSDVSPTARNVQLYTNPVGSSTVCLIADSVPDTGSYAWTIPTSLDRVCWGSQILSVLRLDGSNIKGQSAVFIISSTTTSMFNISEIAPLTSPYPLGGDVTVKVRGVEPDGTWTAVDEGFFASAQVYVGSGPYEPVLYNSAQMYDPTTGWYSISVPAPSMAGSYKMRVVINCGFDYGKVCSDRYGSGGPQVEQMVPFTVSTITSTNLPPVINSVIGSNILVVNKVGSWTVKASDADSTSLLYEVNFGEPGIYPGPIASYDQTASPNTNVVFKHSYGAPGNYTIWFWVLDNNNPAVSKTYPVQVMVVNDTVINSSVIEDISINQAEITLQARIKKLEYKVSELEQQLVESEKQLVQKVDTSLTNRVAGKILLQVEGNGEAWYVDKDTQKKFYLKDGNMAYTALRAFGLGITNKDLAKIPVGSAESADKIDTDGDGLVDSLESAIGTDPNNKDSDGDGYLDGEELLNGYSPLGAGKIIGDSKLTNRLNGKILLQVESRGEAWYVLDGKRYYMGDGDSAYQIMRSKSLGINNNDLRKINVGEF